MSGVIFATNGSAACRRATHRASGMFRDSELLVTMAVPGSGSCLRRGERDGCSSIRHAAHTIAVDFAHEVVTWACDVLEPSTLGVVVHGDPCVEICDLALASGAQAIVVGSLDRTPVRRVLSSNSIAGDLLDQAPCTVIELGR